MKLSIEIIKTKGSMSIINDGLDMSNPTGCGSEIRSEMFEIHITGDERIHEVAGDLGYKTIQVNALRPNGSIIYTEHMTSIVRKFDFYEKAHEWTINLAQKLREKCGLTRIKIESPPYPHYYCLATYAEVHFKDDSFKLPTSKNPRKSSYLGTERVRIDKIELLKQQYPNNDVEICLFDTNEAHDSIWFKEYS